MAVAALAVLAGDAIQAILVFVMMCALHHSCACDRRVLRLAVRCRAHCITALLPCMCIPQVICPVCVEQKRCCVQMGVVWQHRQELQCPSFCLQSASQWLCWQWITCSATAVTRQGCRHMLFKAHGSRMSCALSFYALMLEVFVI